MNPRDLANEMSSVVATFTLPIMEARRKAREVIGHAPKNGIISVVENWHVVHDGQIEFSVRNLRHAD